jgi:hypothetical protein
MRQISEPERTRSLPNGYLNLRHEDFAVKASGDFGRGRRLEVECERLDKVGSRLFDRRTFTRNIEFGAQRYKAVVLTFDDRGQALRWLRIPSLQPTQERRASRLRPSWKSLRSSVW